MYMCFLSTLQQWLAALHGLSQPSASQSHVGLLIIGVRPIKKHNALKNDVIV